MRASPTGEVPVHGNEEAEMVHTIRVGRHTDSISVFLHIVVCGVATQLLIDTGASVTVLARYVYEQIPEEQISPIWTPSVGTRLEVANKSYLAVDGTTSLSLCAGGMLFDWNVYIVPICESGSLGMDFLVAHNYLMGAAGFLELNGQVVKTDIVGASQNVFNVTLEQDLTVPAYSELVVDGLVADNALYTVVIEPIPDSNILEKVTVGATLVDDVIPLGSKPVSRQVVSQGPAPEPTGRGKVAMPDPKVNQNPAPTSHVAHVCREMTDDHGPEPEPNKSQVLKQEWRPRLTAKIALW
jgi:hypothetical protein